MELKDRESGSLFFWAADEPWDSGGKLSEGMLVVTERGFVKKRTDRLADRQVIRTTVTQRFTQEPPPLGG
jgi:hypothetical protein